MKRFTDRPEPWGEFVDVKTWSPIKNPPKYAGKEAFIGSVCDAYQPLEAKYGRTRALLEQLRGSGVSVSIATKSDLVLRDLDLIKTFPNARVSWSINTLDEGFRRQMDRVASIGQRLEAMRQFYEAGVHTVCQLAPIFPGVTDVPAIIEAVRDRCNQVWLEDLNLRGDYRARILGWVHANRPELDGLYHAIYSKKDRTYWAGLDAQLRAYCQAEGLEYLRDDDTRRADFGEPLVVVNYFYHGEPTKTARKKRSATPDRG